MLPVCSCRTKHSDDSGATAETDKDILHLSSALYKKPSMRRVYYSLRLCEYVWQASAGIEATALVRENRLYQADWLMRFYQFKVEEIVDDAIRFGFGDWP